MIGVIAAFLTTLALIPQVIKVVKTKKTEGISIVMYIMQVSGILLWAIHGYMIGDIAVLGANIVTFILASIVLVYKIKYH